MSQPHLHKGQMLTDPLFNDEPNPMETMRALPASAGQAGNGPDT